ncbi:MAG: SDR family NAD(P)-dependent oxidoreductase [Alphaproteobacteria bacterium]|nr:SDR family NAD(P)-dependent oxidoreductase [Alphaproteobacteria bacterium]
MAAYLPKIVLITGATGGFGQAFARRFAAAGCRLVLTSRKPGALDTLVQEIKVPVHQMILDVRDRKAVEQAFAALPADFKDIDLLINNAGGAHGQEPAYAANFDDWETMIDVNAKSLALFTRLALTGMTARKAGHIINIGSMAGSYPYPGGHAYCGVKAFVKQFSLALRADLIGTGVRVTNIEPGMAQTDFSLNRFKGDAAKADAVYAGANPLTAQDVAESVFWAATLPQHVNINRIELMPTTQGPGALAVHRGG